MKLSASEDGRSILFEAPGGPLAAWAKIRPKLSLQYKDRRRHVMTVSTSRLGVDDSAEVKDRLQGNLQVAIDVRNMHGRRIEKYEAQIKDPALVDDVVFDPQLPKEQTQLESTRLAASERVASLKIALDAADPKTKALVNMSHGWRAGVSEEVRSQLEGLARESLSADARGDAQARDRALSGYDALTERHGLQAERLAYGEEQLTSSPPAESLRRLRGRARHLTRSIAQRKDAQTRKRTDYRASLPERLAVARERRTAEDLQVEEIEGRETSIFFRDTKFVDAIIS